MIKGDINDIVFKYQVSKFNRSGGQQTLGMSIGTNPLNYSGRTRHCFSPFFKQTGENVSGRVLNAHYVPSQSNTSSLGSPKYLLREPTTVSTPTSQYKVMQRLFWAYQPWCAFLKISVPKFVKEIVRYSSFVIHFGSSHRQVFIKIGIPEKLAKNLKDTGVFFSKVASELY